MSGYTSSGQYSAATMFASQLLGRKLDTSLQTGLQSDNSSAPDDGPVLSAWLAGATPNSPRQLIIDGVCRVSALTGAAGGNWSIVGMGKATGFWFAGSTSSLTNAGSNVKLRNFVLAGPGGYAFLAAGANLLAKRPAANRTLLWSENFATSALPANWTAQAGTWSAGSGLTSPATGQGWNTSLVFNTYYSVERRTIRIFFQFLTSGATLGFGTYASPQAYTDGPSLITVDAAAATLNIMDAWTTGSAPTILASVPLGFTPATGVTYLLTIEQDQRVVTASLSHPVTGSTVSVTGDSGANTSNTGTSAPWGKLNDFPAFVAPVGQYVVSGFSILADGYEPHALFVGDSITWGVANTIATRWPTLVGSQMPGTYLVSGRPGASSVGALARISSELQYIQPKYLVLLIGTNDSGLSIPLSTTQSNLSAIVANAESYGVQVILCTLPTTSTGNTGPYNSYILGLGRPVVRFDLATSTNNDGVTQNASLFASDLTHPNATGCAAMYNRFLVDVPWIFD